MSRFVALTALVITMLASVVTVSAQDCNPYTDPTSPLCIAHPVPGIATCFDPYGDHVQCQVPTPGAAQTAELVPAILYKFGEGVIHAPGSELAWIILTNFGTDTQTVWIELLVSGRPTPVTRSITLRAKERRDLPIHEFAEFADLGIVTFSTAVYFPLATGHASVVMRPAAHPFASVTLPPATVTEQRGSNIAH